MDKHDREMAIAGMILRIEGTARDIDTVAFRQGMDSANGGQRFDEHEAILDQRRRALTRQCAALARIASTEVSA